MKEKRYEKIVEWKEEPNSGLLFFGILFGILTSLNLVMLTITSGIFSMAVIRTNIVLISLNSAVLTIAGLLCFVFGLGEGKKVYYKEIKK